jgi:hypothetical protein
MHVRWPDRQSRSVCARSEWLRHGCDTDANHSALSQAAQPLHKLIYVNGSEPRRSGIVEFIGEIELPIHDQEQACIPP